MTTKQMLDKLQKKFSRKNLKSGCQFKFKNDIWVVDYAEYDSDNIFAFSSSGNKQKFSEKEFETIEIIGHPLTFMDILEYLGKCYKSVDFDLTKDLVAEQKEETIRFIYNLLIRNHKKTRSLRFPSPEF